MSSCPRVTLKANRSYSLQQFHPWVFSGAIQNIDGAVEDGSIVEIYSQEKQFLGMGHYSTGNIALKVWSFERVVDQREFWVKTIVGARSLRQTLKLVDAQQTTAYRLLNGEGDGVPGLIIDIYHDVAVMQCQSVGMYRLREVVGEALQSVFQSSLKAVFCKSTSGVSVETETEEGAGQYLFGECGTGKILENGLCFLVDWEAGQKTGFFIDQRENRALLRTYAQNRVMLNAFCYTGSFSVYGLAGGAKRVVSVDCSKKSVQEAEKNILENFPEIYATETPLRHQTVVADCFHYLADLKEEFDLVVLDPPAFVKHQKALHRGLEGYETVNAYVMKQIAKGGLLFTFSCSQLVSRELFWKVLLKAAARSRRKVQVLHELSQAPCHPVNVYHPEGAYLKGYVLRIE